MSAPWWHQAVLYQVYPRSFADGDGDGTGDLKGLRDRLPYLAALGVDALWICPWYPSPWADGGYDVTDHRGVHPLLGTLADAEELVAAAHAQDLRVLLDLVPNHTATDHPWFRAALAAGPGSPERRRYHFHDGHGDAPPTDWRGAYGRPVWSRVTEPDGTPGQWYLHLFGPQQPDLDWSHPDVSAAFDEVLRFWFDRGVDGLRVDVAHAIAKAPGLRDDGRHPYWDRDEVHDVHRRWRAAADTRTPPRFLIGEVWVDGPERLARYVRPGELHSVFAFDLLTAPWRAGHLRRAVDGTLEALGRVGAAPTWVLGNHDAVRQVSRYGRPQPWHPVRESGELDDAWEDLALGRRRARAAALLMLALPGGACLYQGEELGLEEVEDLPEALLEDPNWELSGRTDRGRDGCRVPLPWTPDGPWLGFGGPPWLPQPPAWRRLAASVQDGDPGSTLELYRAALRLRPAHHGPLRWLDAPADVLDLTRGGTTRCVVNLSAGRHRLPAGHQVLLASGELDGDRLPPDTTVWLRPAP
ncbi:glycoside hydrolase family 13 protein [Streptantibioticus cattleyicolor]|uniref:Alpha-glucosidase n=1 Tax=Streptantibioticus cattleyicolor (strain ATCC 35852 / DSM 46488 / JCM 4925 / NBRC 14057 / NRRL 8057) TaxID=1003195 RepID=F8JJ02_STREN|nr:glycoside hydrolase family 13 protein [Streptantibioticus cattleyicolor]AEW98907.1 alpha-glucosidase [Streptantibioticus cattleyicolor NRRL 8057 = DSM 46488]CCB72046.1 Alpha-glucosidase [Streptantibioticus cattleyicolor NRRL 8057 = DSM 46488]